MESNDVYRRLTEVFRNVFDDSNLVISSEMTANDVDGWDSLRHVRLMLSIERAFDVKFSAYEVNKLKDVAHLAKLIQEKLGART
jgi:acyl carrier protein